MSENGKGESSQSSPSLFPATRWTLVLQARDDESLNAHDALSELCQLYWYPVYCLVRRRGHSPEDAEDLCQSFFQHLLNKRLFERAEIGKGKLRAFLLNALKDHLVDHQRRNSAQKRGGGVAPISLDQTQAEERYRLEPTDEARPDAVFDRAWASTVISRAMKELEASYAQEDKQDFFSQTRIYMSGNDADGHALLAKQLDMNPNTLRVAIHRMRKRFRTILERAITETVDSPENLSEEIRYLLTLFSN